MMRKYLSSPEDLEKMPSLLGRIFRIAIWGKDNYDYSRYYSMSNEEKSAVWDTCRNTLGMHATPDVDDKSRQQYTELHFSNKFN